MTVMAEVAEKVRWTYEELVAQGLDPDEYEILNGELSPAKGVGMEGARLLIRLGARLQDHAERQGLGRIYGGGRFLFRKEPRRERRPDIAFASKARIVPGDPPIYPGVPDLLVEVLSPSDPVGTIFEKTRDDLEDGVREVWIMDPLFLTVTVLMKDRPAQPFGKIGTLETPVLPGLRLSLEELFAPPSP
jgi:Uma2 family endonuclease